MLVCLLCPSRRQPAVDSRIEKTRQRGDETMTTTTCIRDVLALGEQGQNTGRNGIDNKEKGTMERGTDGRWGDGYVGRLGEGFRTNSKALWGIFCFCCALPTTCCGVAATGDLLPVLSSLFTKAAMNSRQQTCLRVPYSRKRKRAPLPPDVVTAVTIPAASLKLARSVGRDDALRSVAAAQQGHSASSVKNPVVLAPVTRSVGQLVYRPPSSSPTSRTVKYSPKSTPKSSTKTYSKSSAKYSGKSSAKYSTKTPKGSKYQKALKTPKSGKASSKPSKSGKSSSKSSWSSKKMPRLQHSAERWNGHYKALQIFVEEHGHTRVPRNVLDPRFRGLGEWVSRQRKAYFNEQARYESKEPNGTERITAEHIVQLQSLNFEWMGVRSHQEWETPFLSLCKFVHRHGHSHVPRDLNTREFPHLGKWVQAQRAAFKKSKKKGNDSGEPGTLSSPQIIRLDSIGFDWDGVTQTEAWERKLQSLRNFVRIKGHAEVPPTADTAQYPGLGYWVTQQRRSYWRQSKIRLTTKQTAAIEATGLRWTMNSEALRRKNPPL